MSSIQPQREMNGTDWRVNPEFSGKLAPDDVVPTPHTEYLIPTTTPRWCPFCGKLDTLTRRGGVFYEAGEWIPTIGVYEEEGSADEWMCMSCRYAFLVTEGAEPIPQTA